MTQILAWSLLLIEWNSIRLGGHAHGIVTKTIHITLASGIEGVWSVGRRGVGSRGIGI